MEAVDDERRDALGPRGVEQRRQQAAERAAEHGAALDPHRVHEALKMPRHHERRGVRARVLEVGEAVAEDVRRIHRKIRRQRVQHMRPDVGAQPEAVDEEKGLVLIAFHKGTSCGYRRYR